MDHYCPDHTKNIEEMGSLKGRINLLIAMMMTSLGGILTLLILSFNVFLGIQVQVTSIDKAVALSEKNVLYLQTELTDIKTRVKGIELYLEKYKEREGK